MPLIDDEWSGMPNRIKELRLAKGLSMAALGTLARTSAQQIDKLEKGNIRLTVDWMVRLAPHLGVEPRDLMIATPTDEAKQPDKIAGGVTKLSAIFRGSPVGNDRTLPVLGRARGGKVGVFIMSVEQEPVAWTYRPRQLEGVTEAYGVFVYDDSMSPKYEHGQTAWVHPHLVPRAGSGVVLVKQNDEALIKLLVSRDDRVVRLRQLNPEEVFEIPASDVRSIHVIVGAIDPII
jgi:phage repressor protein C with HTH and peptisase S24 domain